MPALAEPVRSYSQCTRSSYYRPLRKERGCVLKCLMCIGWAQDPLAERLAKFLMAIALTGLPPTPPESRRIEQMVE